MQVFVVYDTKYGNTKIVAEKIIEGLKESGVETAISYVKDVPLQKLVDYDALVIGAPNHMGKPSRTITKFIDELPRLGLKARWVAVFDTYFAKKKNFEKAMKQMEKRVGEKLPGVMLISPGLSIMVNGVNGPIAEDELPKCIDFGKTLASQLK